MEVDGVSLTIGGSAVASLAGLAGAYIKARFGKTHIPQPMDVAGEIAKKPVFVSVQECNRRMCEMNGRIDRVADGQQKILDKLDEMDTRSERRAKETHDRIDPLVKEIAKNIGQVELIKESFLKATIGGKK